MKKGLFLLVGLLLVVNMAHAEIEDDCRTGEAIVSFESGVIVLPSGGKVSFDSVQINSEAVEQLCLSINAQTFEALFPDEGPDLCEIYLITFGRHDLWVSVYETVNAFNSLPEVIAAEPNALLVNDELPLPLTPNDPFYTSGDQWGLNAIDCPGAWGIADQQGTLGEGIKIAIIDYGVDLSHEDLSSNATGGESGYYDLHGTICAGVAAAVTDNGLGIAGAGWDAKFMPYKFSGSLSEAMQDIEAASWAGANVISMSWSVYSANGDTFPNFRAVLKSAYDKNCILVTSAGNYIGEPFPRNGYPQAYGGRLVISVGAIDQNGYRTWWSNYCPEGESWLDVMAPGEDIYTTKPGNDYEAYDGTSLACPMVAGVLALMCSKDIGYQLTPSEAWEVITSTTEDMEDPGWDRFTGYGFVNACEALATTSVSVEEGKEPDVSRPTTPHLSQNYPNPFNPETEIAYGLSEDCKVRIEIFDLLGRRVATLVDGPQTAGYRMVRWDAGDFPSGVYFCHLQAGDYSESRRMILIK